MASSRSFLENVVKRRRDLHRARAPEDSHCPRHRLRAQAPGQDPLRLRRLSVFFEKREKKQPGVIRHHQKMNQLARMSWCCVWMRPLPRHHGSVRVDAPPLRKARKNEAQVKDRHGQTRSMEPRGALSRAGASFSGVTTFKSCVRHRMHFLLLNGERVIPQTKSPPPATFYPRCKIRKYAVRCSCDVCDVFLRFWRREA